MTKKLVNKKTTKLQKLFLVGAIIAGATGLFMNHAKAADLLYSPKMPKHALIDESGWYIGLKGGANLTDDFSGIGFDTGYTFGGTVGYDWGQVGFASLRTEAELGYFSSEAQAPTPFSGSVGALYGFLNAFADFDVGMPFTPFIGGGVGYADVNGKAQFSGFPFLDAKDQTFAWNATVGLSYPISQNVSFDLAYRYLAIPDVTFSTPFGTVSDAVNSQQVTAGVRFKL